MNCPICNTQLTERYSHSCSYGVEESMHECDKCKQYSRQFAYGSIEIHIGDFMTGYKYNTIQEERNKIIKLISILAKEYKNMLGEYI